MLDRRLVPMLMMMLIPILMMMMTILILMLIIVITMLLLPCQYECCKHPALQAIYPTLPLHLQYFGVRFQEQSVLLLKALLPPSPSAGSSHCCSSSHPRTDRAPQSCRSLYPDDKKGVVAFWNWPGSLLAVARHPRSWVQTGDSAPDTDLSDEAKDV